MEENQKVFKFLNDCAHISETLTYHSLFKNPKITLNVDSKDYSELLKEIEEFVKIKINKNESQVILDISGTEFTFKKI